MKEIKFRVWDTEAKFFIANPNDMSVNWLNRKTKKHIVMQYTGVKDKNKKDIYDGDILKSSEKLHSSGNCWIGVIEDNDFGWVALKYKEYINPSWLGALCEPINEPQTASWIMATCEVIGNRYENPELLEVMK